MGNESQYGAGGEGPTIGSSINIRTRVPVNHMRSRSDSFEPAQTSRHTGWLGQGEHRETDTSRNRECMKKRKILNSSMGSEEDSGIGCEGSRGNMEKKNRGRTGR